MIIKLALSRVITQTGGQFPGGSIGQFHLKCHCISLSGLELGAYRGSHTSRSIHSLASDASQTSRSSSIAAPMSTLCGTRKTPVLLVSGGRECSEVGWHCADIMGNENPILSCGQGQNLGISHAPQASSMGRQKVDGRLTAKNSADNGFVEIGISQEPNLHDGRAVCSSSRARISLPRRSAGSGSALRLPSAHCSFWRMR